MMYYVPLPVFGHFTPEALEIFAQAHNLDTSNQNFSEGVFDFKMCQSPNGKRYGVSEDEQCKPPAKPVTAAKAKPKAAPAKKKESVKMCNEFRPWLPVGQQVAIVPCKK